jgi:hypothetical protein
MSLGPELSPQFQNLEKGIDGRATINHAELPHTKYLIRVPLDRARCSLILYVSFCSVSRPRALQPVLSCAT